MSASITPSEANTLLQGPSPPTYLDVRTPSEFAAGHAPKALNVPVKLGGVQVPNFAEDVSNLVNKDDQLLVGCKSGLRSSLAISILQQEGYTDLTEVQGGFNAWLSDSDLPVER